MKQHSLMECGPVPARSLLAEVQPLVEQFSAAAGVQALSGLLPMLHPRHPRSPEELLPFLESYYSSILVPQDCPALHQAWLHASKGETRELIALDRQLSTVAALRPFAATSQAVAVVHLDRLRPLRDQRLVKRYLDAVRAGEAHGWHTLVYGVTLSLYSLPLRQGLIHFVRQILAGFMRGPKDSPSPAAELRREELVNRIAPDLHAMIDKLLGAPSPASGRDL